MNSQGRERALWRAPLATFSGARPRREWRRHVLAQAGRDGTHDRPAADFGQTLTMTMMDRASAPGESQPSPHGDHPLQALSFRPNDGQEYLAIAQWQIVVIVEDLGGRANRR